MKVRLTIEITPLDGAAMPADPDVLLQALTEDVIEAADLEVDEDLFGMAVRDIGVVS